MTTVSLGMTAVVATAATRRNVLYASKPITLDDEAGLQQKDVALVYNQEVVVENVEKLTMLVTSAPVQVTIAVDDGEIVLTVSDYFLLSAAMDSITVKNVTSGTTAKIRLITN